MPEAPPENALLFLCCENAQDAAGTIAFTPDHMKEKLENLTPDLLKNEIFKEYQKEFYGEGQLWYYYKRTLAPTIEANKNYFTSIDLYTFDRK